MIGDGWWFLNRFGIISHLDLPFFREGNKRMRFVFILKEMLFYDRHEF